MRTERSRISTDGTAKTVAPEFCRVIDLPGCLAAGEAAITLVAEPRERAALARRFGLVGLDRLEARLDINAAPHGGLRVCGTLCAELIQTCVVSLEPFASQLQLEVDVGFMAGISAVEEPAPAALLTDPAAPDPPEHLPADGKVDLGELVVQYLSEGLDPYPRKPDAEWSGDLEPGRPQAGPENGPFAVLGVLKNSSRD